MASVIFTAAARAEALDAVDWYEARRPGLGQRFTAELDAVITRIGENPLRFPVVRNDIHRALLRGFPYGIFFRVLPEFVQIIACFHTSREPRRWQSLT